MNPGTWLITSAGNTVFALGTYDVSPDGKEVAYEEIGHGYELDSGKQVVLTDHMASNTFFTVAFGNPGNYGATFMVLAPEHPLVAKIVRAYEAFEHASEEHK